VTTLTQELLARRAEAEKLIAGIDSMLARVAKTQPEPAPATATQRPAESATEPAYDTSDSVAEPFRGRAMPARRRSPCAVCGAWLELGAQILWNGDLRKAAHAQCGEVDGR
jgi:hypothetical protein